MNEDTLELEHRYEPGSLDASGSTESRLGEATHFGHRPADPSPSLPLFCRSVHGMAGANPLQSSRHFGACGSAVGGQEDKSDR
jgi:hypothetical protein